ncbi:SpoIIE family protein phosphatase [Aquipuribacter nitratireducens]|uniref:SpoIIE family protein phosphatase n=1 Tax=Aquipuribacter nitratireducens TaxID=650104 RepID=A0ABW0GQL2_9MICO
MAGVRRASRRVPVRRDGVRRPDRPERGDTLLLYTDGLIEGTGDLEAGLAALGSHARTLRSRTTEVLAERLVELLRADARHLDDTLVLAARRVGD